MNISLKSRRDNESEVTLKGGLSRSCLASEFHVIVLHKREYSPALHRDHFGMVEERFAELRKHMGSPT